MSRAGKRAFGRILPVPGHRMMTRYLPRDIRLGTGGDNETVGTLLEGWCTTTNTRQLWCVRSIGPAGEAEFVGFICNEPASEHMSHAGVKTPGRSSPRMKVAGVTRKGGRKKKKI